MSKLAQALSDKRFVVSVELDPPRGVDLGPLMDLADALASRVQALVLSDNRGAVPRMNPLLAAAGLAKRTEAEVVLTLACRDRNRLALTSDMLAAGAAGVTGLLLVSGDHVSLGDHPGGKPVHDLDSVQALQLAGGLAQGRDYSGAGLAGAPSFLLGASVHPQANPLAPQVMKLRKKIKAGAAFLISSPLDSAEALLRLRQASGDLGVPILAGVELRDPSQREQKAALVQDIKAAGLADGVHLSCPAAPQLLPEWLAACGL